MFRAKPIPAHIAEPVELVEVPLDEEALHGFPLFPPELVLPGEIEMAGGEEEGDGGEEGDGTLEWPSHPPKEPFDGIDENIDFVDAKDKNEIDLVSSSNENNDDDDLDNNELVPIETVDDFSSKNNDNSDERIVPKVPFNRYRHARLLSSIRRQLS